MAVHNAFIFVVVSLSLRWTCSVASSPEECSPGIPSPDYSDASTDLFLFQVALRLDKKQHNATVLATAGEQAPAFQQPKHPQAASIARVWWEARASHGFMHSLMYEALAFADPEVHTFGSNIAQFFGRIAAAFLAVFSMCTDDLLWFMPFAISPRKHTFCAWYLLFMELTVLVSWALVGLVTWVEEQWPSVPLEVILEAMSTVFLAYYTISLFVEWYYEKDDDNDNDEASSQAEDGDNDKNKDEIISNDGKPRASRTRTVSQLFFISVLGNLDNFAIYIALLFAGVLSGPELMVGAGLSAVLVCAICIGLSWLQIIRTIFEHIPLWGILAVITVYSAVLLVLEIK